MTTLDVLKKNRDNMMNALVNGILTQDEQAILADVLYDLEDMIAEGESNPSPSQVSAPYPFDC